MSDCVVDTMRGNWNSSDSTVDDTRDLDVLLLLRVAAGAVAQQSPAQSGGE